MLDIFMEEKVISILMAACLVLSIFLRVFLGLIYQNMIKEADNMASKNNKFLKQCKLKFANCYQLSNGVANIPVFVDKFLNRLAFGHLSFDMIYHLSGQMILLSVVFSGIGICRVIMRGRTLGDILPFYIVSFMGLYLYFSVSTVTDIKGKKRVLKVNLIDYLENHLSPRIDVTKQDIEMLYGEEIFGNSPGMTKRLGRGNIRDVRSGVKNGRKSKKTVELMPIGGRMMPDERRDLLAVADRFADSRADRGYDADTYIEAEEHSGSPAVTEEELEALLREFLAT